MTSPLKLYVDLLSGPCRAVSLFMRCNKIPYQEVRVSLLTRQNKRNPEIKSALRLGTVPALIDEESGLKLSESAAIMKYLADKYRHEEDFEQRWYPADPESRAKIDEYISWHHLNLRLLTMQYFRRRVMGRKPVDPKKVLEDVERLDDCLDEFENNFLDPRKVAFIHGFRDVSIADLLFINEIENLSWTGLNYRVERPMISEYYDNVMSEIEGLYWNQAHDIPVLDRLLIQLSCAIDSYLFFWKR